MNWACLYDRTALTLQDAVLSCPSCNRDYDVVGGIPVFTRNDRERAEIERQPPLVEELWQSMQSRSAVEAAAAFCERHDCVRSPYSPDHKYFFAAPTEGIALEIGAGFGDDSVVLAGSAGCTISIVPNLTNARLVGKHVRERVGSDWPVAVMREVSRLPLADSSVQTVAMEDAAAAGFELSDASFSAVATEWNRILAPGGAVLLGLANGVHRLPGLRQRARGRPESLNRLVKKSAAGSHGRLGAARTIRTMTGLGFEAPVVYAPLPDENDPRIVVPADDARVVQYLLSHLIRRNSRAVRLAIRSAQGIVALGLFRYFVPYYYLVFRKPHAETNGPH